MRTTPGKLCRDLKGDLDTIVLKALSKAPRDRYPTADAFAQDIGRHLRGEPVLARPESRWYRAGKFVMRNKLAVGLASAICLAADCRGRRPPGLRSMRHAGPNAVSGR